MPTTEFSLRRFAGLSLTVLALGFGVAACGGGDDSSDPVPAATTGTTEVASITQADLISQGDSVCAEANSALGSISTSTADETTKSSQISDIYEGIAQQLGELGTPSDGDPPTDVIAAAQDLADGSTDVTGFQTAAEEYGFTDCAEAPEATSYPSTGTDSTSTDGSSTETYTPPTTDSTETYTPPVTTPPPSTGGGVAPTTPSTGGSSTGGSSGGSSSGGIGPG